MSIYDFDAEIIAEQITPPVLRKPKHLAWLNVIVRPIQYLWERFRDWYAGVNYADWAILTSYSAGTRVVWTDRAVYEARVPHTSLGFNEPTGAVDSAATWRKVQQFHIGADERVRYTSQIIVLEYALNKWYRIPTTDPQIYIENNAGNNSMVMGNTGPVSTPMPNSSAFQVGYMANSPTFSAYDFTVYVPVAVWNTLGATNTVRELNVKSFVNFYKLAGINYNVTSY